MAEPNVYSAEQIVGKTLIAKRIVDVWNRVPDIPGATKIAGVKAGMPVGVVYSWVQNSQDKSYWWQFKNANGTFYYVQHAPGYFDIDALRQQGALSTLEQIELEKKKEEENRPWYEKLGENVGKLVTNGVLLLGGFLLIREMIRSSKKN
jgi:hypothetical protein